MIDRLTRRTSRQRIWLHSATILATGMLAAGFATEAAAEELASGATTAEAAATAEAAQATPAPAAADDEDIVVTGIRASLRNSANAKRDNVGFSETIFADDIGDFPDTNLAESFNRVPGITITREISGDGLNIAIRGLGTNFTRILLNGAPVAIASTGRTNSQNTNREVDLDLFPSELFTQLTVYKTPMASMIEGGAAGSVNMRTARPFDNPGMHLTYSAQLTNNNNTDRWGGRGSLVASYTSGDFEILLGVAAARTEVRVRGFETIGWTNPNLSAAQCAGTCNTTGGGNWTIPPVVPANAGNNLTPGATIDQAFLLARNPGLTIQQLDNAIIPRLGRPTDEFGRRDRISSVLALEWRPSDAFHFYVDGMYGWRKNDFERIDMNWVGRNGAMIPLNTQVDNTDCSNGCVVTSATYANAQWFLEYRPHIETVEFWGVNPGFELELTPNLRIDGQANWTESSFHRESPTVLVITPASSGVTVNYTNDGTTPDIQTNIDLNNPANFGWAGGRVNIQDERRNTRTRGFRANLRWGDDELNLRVGGAFDDVSRRIRAFDNSQAWQNAVCGNQPTAFVPGPNTQPQCRGLNLPGAAQAGDPSYPAYGTGFTAGQAGPVTYRGSLIPSGALAQYLVPGPSGFITVDWERFAAASNYNQFHDAAPQATSSNTSANAGFVGEKTYGLYAEINGDTLLGGNRLRYNLGVRWVETHQRIGGFVSVPDPRNAQDPDGAGPLPAGCPGTGNVRDGSCYPNALNFVYTNSTYDNWLPSVSAAYNLSEQAIVRASLSRTMTRPNPNAMLPGLNFSSPSADTGTRGNPSLAPFISDNIDFGVEYYLGGGSYIAVAAFRKSIEGFTVNGSITVPFADLAQYGVTFDTLTPTQQAAITSRGGPGSASVVLTQQVNANGRLIVNGIEATWVQSLDFLLGRHLGINGFGFSVNGTIIDQKGSGTGAPAIAVGVSPHTYNATVYYENHGISARLSTTWAEGSQSTLANQNGITNAALFSNDYQQWDFSSSLDLAEIFNSPRLPSLTFDVVNLFEAEQRSYFQFENAAFTSYKPGRTVLIGLRGRF